MDSPFRLEIKNAPPGRTERASSVCAPDEPPDPPARSAPDSVFPPAAAQAGVEVYPTTNGWIIRLGDAALTTVSSIVFPRCKKKLQASPALPIENLATGHPQ
jgi:hypothetical protein